MSVLHFWALLTFIAAPSLSLELGLDDEQKEFVLNGINGMIQQAKSGNTIPPDTLSFYDIDILPEDPNRTVDQYKSLDKSTLIFHTDGHVSFVDTDKGELVVLVSAEGELDEEILAKIFTPEFMKNIVETNNKKEFLAKQIKKMRKEAMKTNRDITETILGKKFVFNNNGAVVLEANNGSVIGEFDANSKIDEFAVGAIFSDAEIQTVEIVKEEMPPAEIQPVEEERMVPGVLIAAKPTTQAPPSSGDASLSLISSLLLVVLGLRVSVLI